MSAPAEWFRDWFGDAYLELYPHRDEDEAAAGVSLFTDQTELAHGSRVLDLACGAGRHLERLRARGLEATGIDLSAALLREATGRPGVPGALVRADMRALPFGDEVFAGLVNFFTSFGYFLTAQEDAGVLREVRRVLRPGAPFLMDYMNAPWVIDRLEPETVGEINGQRVRQTRWVEDDQVFKRIEIERGDGEAAEVFHERVRLYPPDALDELLRDHGLVPGPRFGGYSMQPFTPDSPRLIVLGEAE